MAKAATMKVTRTNDALIIEREFNAPRELVFEAWTKAEHVARWIAPDIFTIPTCEWDARPRGRLALVMEGPEGLRHAMRGEFQEVAPPERLVFTTEVDGPDGELAMRLEQHVRFEAAGERTALRIEVRVLYASEVGAQFVGGMEEGWAQSLNKLQALLASL